MILRALLLANALGFAAAIASCAYEPRPGSPLWAAASDGCSSSPDLGAAVVCCDRHDARYRQGGYDGLWTERARKHADLEFYACLLEHEVPAVFADGYFRAVRGPAGRKAWEQNMRAAGFRLW